jgi:hypothetical protein
LISMLSIFPNPAKDYFTVGFTAKHNESIRAELISFDGRIVWQTQSVIRQGSNSIRIDRNDMPSGIYLMRLRTPEGDLARKLVVK